jgi:uncharacterized protein (TIGR03083 family)
MTAEWLTVMAMTHDDWMDAAAEEYRRLGALLDGLGRDEWSLATDCAGWTVKDLVAHLVGAAEANASMRARLREAWTAARGRAKGQLFIDALNAVQVAARADWTPDRLRAALRDAGERSVRVRRRTPAPVRALRLPLGAPLGVCALGHALDCIYTRDAWMHRVDLARATGRGLELTADHDGRIVADVVREWADGHRQPFGLDLTGEAGGAWSRGHDGSELRLDAVEFCRIASGREQGTGLLAQPVVF